MVVPETEELLVPNGVYVLVKRFTAKEERRRVVATVFRPEGNLAGFPSVGFENHLNYFHRNGGALDGALAEGLAVFLNSTLVDSYFRQFSGHTQVNATDLRSLRYPSKEQLYFLSGSVEAGTRDQPAIDAAVGAMIRRATVMAGLSSSRRRSILFKGSPSGGGRNAGFEREPVGRHTERRSS